VTIGSGTLSNYLYGPIYRSSATSSFDFSRYHYILTASELSAAGVTPGATISSIAFYKNSTGVIDEPGNADFDIYMLNSSATSLGSSGTWSSLTGSSTLVGSYVFNTTNNLPNTAGWMTLTLTTPFVYTGGAIEISADWDISAISSSSPTDGDFDWLYDTYTGGVSLGAASSSATSVDNLTDGSYGGTERPICN
jgi:hypothetical protein